MEKNLELVLAWLGLSQYHERFVQAGFDSWETLLEITEGDLEILEVDLGHRRKLQKEIQKSRTLAAAQVTTQRTKRKQQEGYDPQQMSAYLDPGASSALTAEPDFFTTDSTIPTKRGYRHHPKADPNAPKRPYSAYVLFSNHVRALLAAENLDFPEISRQVGQRWQAMSAEEKDMWKQQAQPLWDQYKKEAAQYQGTKEHAEHKRYLEEFRVSQAGRGERDVRTAAGSQEVLIRGIAGPGATTNIYPTPGPTPAGTSNALSDSYGSMTSTVAPPSGIEIAGLSTSPKTKVPIRKLKDSMKEVTEEVDKKPRSKHACEPCRRRKTKCNEERPTCGHCLALNVGCYYSDGRLHTDKRKFQELSKKLEMCQKLLAQVKPQLQRDEQNLIQQALNLPPYLDDRQSSTQQTSYVDAQLSSFGGADYSEDDVPGLEGMEAISHMSEDDFAHEGMDLRSRAFAGQSSDVQWMQSLANELQHDGGGGRQTQLPTPYYAQSSIFAEDNESAVVGNNVDPFQLPIVTTADTLVDGYFLTVHVSFPILNKSRFMHQYNKLRLVWHKPVEFEDRVFITILQLVLAIGAVHARLSSSVEVSDDRDHLLYFTRARILAIDSGIFNDQVHLGQAQVFGLAAMYCLVTDQMNRAWIASGLAIRSAQSLGLQFQSTIQSISNIQKEYRWQIWSALLSLENTMAIMAGRPSMVQDRSCSLDLPSPGFENLSSPVSHLGKHHRVPPSKEIGYQKSEARRSSMSEASHASSPVDMTPTQSPSSIKTRYFEHHVELTALAHDSVSQLYTPAIRQQRWSKIQALVDKFDDRLMTWKRKLDSPFGNPMSDFSLDLRRSPLSIALAIQFHCTRAIINRPCLCRQERTTSKQSSLVAVSRCVGSAREAIDIVVNSPISVLLHQGPQWWLLLHHLKRMLTVLLLELAFRAEHMPSEAGDLLAVAKKAVQWLHRMARTSKLAENIWIAMSSLLVKAGRRVGIETGAEVFSDGSLESLGDWPQYSTPDSTASFQSPMPPTGFHQTQPLNGIQPGGSLDPSAFGHYMTYPDNAFQPSRDQEMYHNIMGSEAFDHFSFEPMINGQGGVPASDDLYRSAAVGGQMHLPHASSAMPQGFSISALQKDQYHERQQHNHGSGGEAEGYPGSHLGWI